MVIPSLFTGAGAVTTFQNALGIVANNIANVNTTAFKKAKVFFAESVSNLLNPASSPTPVKGGTNPIEQGTGTKIGNISTIFTQGALKNSGVATDLAMSGSGFFVLSSSMTDTATSTSGLMYTRDGHFMIDSEENLTSADGARVLGATFFDSTTGKVKAVDGYTNISYFLDQDVGPSSSPYYLPNNGLGTNKPVPVAGTHYTTTNVTGATVAFDSSKISEISVRGGLLESGTNINVTTNGNLTFTRQSDGKLLVSFDDANAGTAASTYKVAIDTTQKFLDNTLSFTLTNTPGDTIQLRLRLEPGVTSLESVFKNIDYDSATSTSDSLVLLGGAVTTQSGTAITTGNDDMPYLSVTDLQSLIGAIKIPNFFYTQDSTVEIETASYAIRPDGTLSIFGPGSEELKLGRVLVGNFTNPDGLLNKGDNRFEESSNSGIAALSVIGGPFDRNAPSLSESKIVSGSLEASNVNIADEFAELITIQRALQANAKTISTTDEVLQTLINL